MINKKNLFFLKKFPELKNENGFSVVKIMNTWNKSFSIFYVTIADSTMLKNVKITQLNVILNNLASKWDSKSSNFFFIYFFLIFLVYPPYIEGISAYFSTNVMKKADADFHSKRTKL